MDGHHSSFPEMPHLPVDGSFHSNPDLANPANAAMVEQMKVLDRMAALDRLKEIELERLRLLDSGLSAPNQQHEAPVMKNRNAQIPQMETPSFMQPFGGASGFSSGLPQMLPGMVPESVLQQMMYAHLPHNYGPLPTVPFPHREVSTDSGSFGMSGHSGNFSLENALDASSSFQGTPPMVSSRRNRTKQPNNSGNNKFSVTIPKEVTSKFPSQAEDQETTTVIVRNVAQRYTQRMLVQLFDHHGFDRCYDFVHLHVNLQNRAQHLGICIVNFVKGKYAEEFMKAFNGFQIPNSKTKGGRGLIVVPGKVQGYDANVRQWFVQSHQEGYVPPEYQPLVFDPNSGKEMRFPANPFFGDQPQRDSRRDMYERSKARRARVEM